MYINFTICKGMRVHAGKIFANTTKTFSSRTLFMPVQNFCLVATWKAKSHLKKSMTFFTGQFMQLKIALRIMLVNVLECVKYHSAFYLLSSSITLSGCLKCSFSSSGSFGFCQTFDLFSGWFLIPYDRV